jgi:hypothetical protein
VTVFDETLTIPANVPLGATDCLLAAAPTIPAGNTPSIGVTPLTHIAAVAALAHSTADPTATVSSIARVAALAAEFKAGPNKFTTSVSAVEGAAAKLPAVAASFYGAGFTPGIVGLASVLRPDANGDGTPTMPPISTGVVGSSLRGG